MFGAARCRSPASASISLQIEGREQTGKEVTEVRLSLLEHQPDVSQRDADRLRPRGSRETKEENENGFGTK